MRSAETPAKSRGCCRPWLRGQGAKHLQQMALHELSFRVHHEPQELPPTRLPTRSLFISGRVASASRDSRSITSCTARTKRVAAVDLIRGLGPPYWPPY